MALHFKQLQGIQKKNAETENVKKDQGINQIKITYGKQGTLFHLERLLSQKEPLFIGQTHSFRRVTIFCNSMN